MKNTVLKTSKAKIRNPFKKNLNCLLFIFVLTFTTFISCNISNPIVTIVNNSDCDITNLELNFVNPRIVEENGKQFGTNGYVKHDTYLKNGEEADFIKEPALYGSIGYDCICNGNKQTIVKEFVPFKPKSSLKITFIHVDCNKNSKARIEIK